MKMLFKAKSKSKEKKPQAAYSDSGSSDTNKLDLIDLAPAARSKCLREMNSGWPKKVQSRLVALKNIQLQQMENIADYQNEIWELEKKFNEIYKPLYDQRAKIISGQLEPPKNEPEYKDHVNDEETKEDFSKQLKPWTALPKTVKGVPNFWLTVLKANQKTASLIYRREDEEALKSLYDIKIVYKLTSFVLEFYFEKNCYFKDQMLKKTYQMLTDPDDFERPFRYKKPEIFRTNGCKIEWEPNMNLTMKSVEASMKNRIPSGPKLRIKRQKRCDSFFNFFDPPILKINDVKADEETKEILAEDFEVAECLRKEIIPNAVLYFTGDRIDNNDEDDSDDSDYETEDDEEETDTDSEKAEKKKAKNK